MKIHYAVVAAAALMSTSSGTGDTAFTIDEKSRLQKSIADVPRDDIKLNVARSVVQKIGKDDENGQNNLHVEDREELAQRETAKAEAQPDQIPKTTVVSTIPFFNTSSEIVPNSRKIWRDNTKKEQVSAQKSTLTLAAHRLDDEKKDDHTNTQVEDNEEIAKKETAKVETTKDELLTDTPLKTAVSDTSSIDKPASRKIWRDNTKKEQVSAQKSTLTVAAQKFDNEKKDDRTTSHVEDIEEIAKEETPKVETKKDELVTDTPLKTAVSDTSSIDKPASRKIWRDNTKKEQVSAQKSTLTVAAQNFDNEKKDDRTTSHVEDIEEIAKEETPKVEAKKDELMTDTQLQTAVSVTPSVDVPISRRIWRDESKKEQVSAEKSTLTVAAHRIDDEKKDDHTNTQVEDNEEIAKKETAKVETTKDELLTDTPLKTAVSDTSSIDKPASRKIWRDNTKKEQVSAQKSTLTVAAQNFDNEKKDDRTTSHVEDIEEIAKEETPKVEAKKDELLTDTPLKTAVSDTSSIDKPASRKIWRDNTKKEQVSAQKSTLTVVAQNFDNEKKDDRTTSHVEDIEEIAKEETPKVEAKKDELLTDTPLKTAVSDTSSIDKPASRKIWRDNTKKEQVSAQKSTLTVAAQKFDNEKKDDRTTSHVEDIEEIAKEETPKVETKKDELVTDTPLKTAVSDTSSIDKPASRKIWRDNTKKEQVSAQESTLTVVAQNFDNEKKDDRTTSHVEDIEEIAKEETPKVEAKKDELLTDTPLKTAVSDTSSIDKPASRKIWRDNTKKEQVSAQKSTLTVAAQKFDNEKKDDRTTSHVEDIEEIAKEETPKVEAKKDELVTDTLLKTAVSDTPSVDVPFSRRIWRDESKKEQVSAEKSTLTVAAHRLDDEKKDDHTNTQVEDNEEIAKKETAKVETTKDELLTDTPLKTAVSDTSPIDKPTSRKIWRDNTKKEQVSAQKSTLTVAAQKFDNEKKDDRTTSHVEDIVEIEKEETPKVEAKKDELVTDTPLKTAVSDTPSVDVPFSRRIWRDESKREQVSAQRDHLNKAAQKFDKKKYDDRTTSHVEDIEEIAKEETPKVEAKKDELVTDTPLKTAVSDTPSVDVPFSRRIWRDELKKEQVSAEKSTLTVAAHRLDDEKKDDHTNTQVEDIEEIAKKETAKVETTKDELLTDTPLKTAVSDTSSIDKPTSRKIWRDNTKKEQVSAQKSTLTVAAQKFDNEKKDDRTTSHVENIEEIAKEETPKVEAKKDELVTDTLLKTAVSDTPSVDVPFSRRIWRDELKKEQVSAQKSTLTVAAQRLDDEKKDDHTNTQVEDNEEIAKKETAKVETTKDELLTDTPLKSAVSDTSPIDKPTSRKMWRDNTKKEQVSAQKSTLTVAAQKFDNEKKDDRTTSQVEGNGEIAKKETAKVETTKDERVAGTPLSKIAKPDTPSVSAPASRRIWRDVIKNEEVSAQEGGLNETAQNLDDEKEDEHTDSRAEDVEDVAEKETAKVETTKDENVTGTPLSKIAVSDISSVNAPASRKIWRDVTKKEGVSVQKSGLNETAQELDDEKEDEHTDPRAGDVEDVAMKETVKVETSKDEHVAGTPLSKIAVSDTPSVSASASRRIWRDAIKKEEVSAQEGDLSETAQNFDDEIEDEHTDSRAEDVEDVAKKETAKVETTKDEHVTGTSLSHIAISGTPSVNEPTLRRIWREVTKKEVSAQKGGLNETAQNLDDEKEDEHTDSRAEDVEDVAEKETAKVETTKDENVTGTPLSKIAVSDISSVNAPASRKIWRDVTKKEGVSVQKSGLNETAQELDDEKEDEHTDPRAGDVEDVAMKETVKVETSKDEHVAGSPLSKIAVSDTPSVSAPDSRRIWRDAIKTEEVSAQEGGLSETAQNLDDEIEDEHTDSQAEDVEDVAKKETAKVETTKDEHVTGTPLSNIAASDTPSVNEPTLTRIWRDVTKKEEVSAQKGGLNEAAQNLDDEKEDEHTDSQAEDVEDVAKKETTKEETTKDQLFETKLPSAIPLSITSSVNVANLKRIRKGSIMTDALTTRKGATNIASKILDEDSEDDHENSQTEEEDEIEETENEKMVKEETDKTEHLTVAAPSKVALSNTSSANATDTQITAKDVTKNIDMSAQKGVSNLVAQNSDEWNKGKHSNLRDEEEVDETEQDKILKNETAKTELVKAIASSKIGVFNTSSQNPLKDDGMGNDISTQNLISSTISPPTALPIATADGSGAKKEIERANHREDKSVLSVAKAAAGRSKNREESEHDKEDDSSDEDALFTEKHVSEDDSSDE